MSQVPYGPGPAGPAPWQGPPSRRGPSQLPTIIAIVIAVIAVAVAIGAWFRPMPKPEAPAAKTYSEQEVADAKKAVCEAHDQVQKSVNTAGGKSGDNPTDTFLVAVNIRLALATSSSYLTESLNTHPAAPQNLVEPIRNLANKYREIVMEQLADTSASDLNPLATSADGEIAKIKQACQ
ncbi:hypothetical protein [Mycobacterium sp. shizuoka-1]|uniref:hypothetical protein n=1 Tax=Mycobacterium sp. shizuoka-1 TaxID=2039281 RepID=UPI000C063F90|nr:hypothetical protein [Mycobacterium sp. shizuoka-1]GAY17405.1 hypothetical protein MSZK_41310 [Mycobacterium sp. shizuoka-1]